MEKNEVKIDTLAPFGHILLQHREFIVDHWIIEPRVQQVFSRFNIENNWFKEQYGDHILSHFIKILLKEREPGNCPYMNHMVLYLKEKDVEVSDIFSICINLRKAVRHFLFRHEDEQLRSIMEHTSPYELCDEINNLFDENLHGVLKIFSTTLSGKERQIQEYVDIIESNVIISKTDLKGIIIYVSQAFCNVSGYSKKELIGKSHNIIRHPDIPRSVFQDMWTTLKEGRIWQGELKNMSREGRTYYVEGTIEPLYDKEGNLYGYMGIRHDITDAVTMYKDPLTQINNRLKLEECLKDEIVRSRRYHTPFSVILLDIDNFKNVNDSYGHKTGDMVLIKITKLINKHIRNSDVFARWGGEEFVILSPDPIGKAVHFAERLCRLIHKSRLLGAGKPVTASFGVTEYTRNDTEDSLFRRVDSYMYHAKHQGKNRVVSDLSQFADL